tara:strand:- start:639 stop:1967 length:1329 start_codon:yes stop_codon:yes gene_type:complete
MAATTATSKVSPVVIGSGRMKSTTYIATKVTGPIKNAAGEETFLPEIIQYDDAKGSGAKTIATRSAETGEITWNDNASGRTKLNASKFKKASNNQMQSIERELTSTASEKVGLNKAIGRANQEVSSNIGNSDTTRPTTPSSTFSGGSPSKAGPHPTRKSYSKSLVYPTTLRTSQQDSLRISVLKYEPRKLGAGAKGKKGLGFADRSSATGRTIGAVTLPIPGGVQDGNMTSWGNGTMTPLDIATSDAVKSFLGNGSEGGTAAVDSVKQSIQAAKDGGADISKAMENMFTQNLTGTKDLLSRTEGMVMNPNMELLFKGPQLRPFGFTYRLSPRDESESMVILKIIRMFKQSMAPQKTDSQLFLKAPSTYKLEFISPRGAKTHRFLPKIKECALENFGVNYTPDGNYMTYDNSSMVAYELTFSFKEIEPIYNNDMDSKDYDIGF